ncbi:MAG TPA: type III-A CRISPR-associated RAMP protein Csm5, partial [Thermoanaerobacterales bacterium]|nr:type III-A CRISPR-associated RAMP protein Csm5 [Thermoanaerobacterales bacterium]
MAFILKILSPVHIHSGEVVKSMNYTVRNKEVLIFDEIDVIQSIEQKEILNDELLRNFAASDNRRKEYNKTLNYYINRGIIHKSVIDKYKTKAINNVQDLSGQEIYRMMMNIRGPYIPGSTLKGAVRTAILYDYLLNKGIDYIKDAVDFLNYRGGRYLIDDYIIY